MEKINFVNGQKPVLNATNLNQMQTNVENAIKEVEEQITTENEKLLELLTAENELLRNQIPTGTATGESITLNDSSNLPLKIDTIEGNAEVKVTGKNLYDGNEVNSEKTYNSILNTDVNSKWYQYVDITKLSFPLTISTYINAITYTNTKLMVYLHDKDKGTINILSGNTATSSNKRSVITLDETKITEDVAYIRIYVRIQDGGNTENTQIEYGDTASDCEPYKEQTATLPLSEGQELTSYKNVTNIFSTKEIKVTYYKDLETMFNNLSN